MVLALGPACHRPRACHDAAPAAAPHERRRVRRGLLALAGFGLLAACLPTHGWQHSDRRACDPQSPPILCLTAHVEGPVELRVGERVLLPGECLEGPPDTGSGRLSVSLHESGKEIARRRIGLAKGVRTIVRLDGRRVEVVDEQRCDGRVP